MLVGYRFDSRFVPRQRTEPNRSFDLHPNGNRFEVAILQGGRTEAQQDKIVFIFIFFDELGRIAPVKR
jgi:hypothetical protein